MKSVQRPLSALLFIPFVLSSIFYSLATNRYIYFSFFLMAVILSCLFYAIVSRFWVKMELQAPERVTEGDDAEISLIINSKWRLPRFVGRVVVEIVEPNGILERAAGRPKKTRFSMFYKHSFETTASFIANSSFQMDGFILKRGITHVHRTINLESRGKAKIQKVILYFSDPFGIFLIRRCYKIKQNILVLVKPTKGSSLLNISGAAGRLDTTTVVGESGEMTEFAGTRPYRPGDDLKHIHWPSVAKTGELFVREYTQSSADSIAVLLLRKYIENPGKKNIPPGGEIMLKAAAALVIELFDRRIQTFFGTNLRGGKEMNIGYSKHTLHLFHDELSSVAWTEKPTELSFLERMVIPGVDKSCVIVFCVDTPEIDMLEQVPRMLRIPSNRIIVIAHQSPEGEILGEVPGGMHLVPYQEGKAEELFCSINM